MTDNWMGEDYRICVGVIKGASNTTMTAELSHNDSRSKSREDTNPVSTRDQEN